MPVEIDDTALASWPRGRRVSPSRRSCSLSLGSVSNGSFTAPMAIPSLPPVSVDAYFAALDHHVAVGLHIDLPRAADRNVLALDRDRSVFLHRDACVPGLDRHRVTRVDNQVLAHFERIVLADARRPPT